MALRASQDPDAAVVPLINKSFGSAYANVRYVAKYIPDLLNITENMEDILSVADGIPAINADLALKADSLNTATGGTAPRQLMDRFGEVKNVLDFGAVGDGVTDDGLAFQAALDAISAAGGGVLSIPPAPSGQYLIGRCLRHPSNIVVRGSGAAAVLITAADFTASSDYGGTAQWLNANSESAETAFTAYRDFNITFENVHIDMTNAPLEGAAHAIFHRAAQHVRILNCNFIEGGDGTAAITCDDHAVIGCRAVGQYNCCYDHWGGSTNCRVIGSYGAISEDATGQIVNFNGIRTGSGGGAEEAWHADGFVLADCDLYGNATSQRSVNIEPLGTGNSSVKNVRIANNRFYNARLIIGGDCQHVSAMGNHFLGSTGNTATVWVREQTSQKPSNVTIAFNKFISCDSPANQGLIDTVSDVTSVFGNTADGGTYDYGIVFRSSTYGTAAYNQFPDAVILPISGNYDLGGPLRLGAEKLEFRGDNNHRPYLAMNGDTLYLVTTTASNGPRSVWSIATASDSSQFQIYPNTAHVGLLRVSYIEGLEATGSTASDPLTLTAQKNVVATTAAGTGVRVPTASGGGLEISIWNDGANTLKVYPPTGGQINSGGVNIPVTLASGASGRWISVAAGLYRTAA